MMSNEPAEKPEQHVDEVELYDVGPVTPTTYFWIFLMVFYIFATGIGLYFAMGNSYVTLPQGNWILR
jgi:Ni,Fe-hydrogenase I cytochrome b subunit